MKILLVSDYATPIGGAEAALFTLRDGLRRRGHDARVFTSSAQPGGDGNVADYQCFGTTSRYRTLLQTANPWAYHKLRRVLTEFRPDVVHVKIFLTQLSPLILPLLKDVPSLYHAVWYRPVCPVGTKLFRDGTPCTVAAGSACYRNHCLPLRDWLPLMVQMKLWRRWRKVFNLIVANSETVKSHLVGNGIQPVEVVWNGVPVWPQRPPLSSPPIVAFAGRLVPEKGVDLLLRAFSRVQRAVPEARLLIAGDGPQRTQAQKLAATLQLSSAVHFLGHLAPQDLEERFASAWVQVVPSRWAEPFGLVAAEAMMRGTAVVASRTGGLAEIVQDGRTGLLVSPGDVDGLGEAMVRLLTNRELAERMGNEGRQVSLAHFNESTYVDRFVEYYHKLRVLVREQPSIRYDRAWHSNV
jgi:glycosyltransferase involved in cell wall biosynthesis